ncbi:long-chain acyl-CoA synthetase [Streptomyces sp. yr375]|uniref:class I adenylate-forming enzyme family protein n=1 Tax=Streptomyces sp. yr375 TaxID=1761906 RepID=UPI0008B692CA|nr:class I adenylate-forming enzyme family protein [Streptomyces sp. yr375]SER74783.1 long-chain acyl-CoA synthetase [Streptomyces sp. yr375]
MISGNAWEFEDKARTDSLLVAACRRFGESTAVIGGDSEISFGQLLSDSQEIASRLRETGIGPGTAVALIVANRLGDIAAQLGIWLAGGAVVPLNAALPPTAVQRVLRRSGARLAVSCEGELPSDWAEHHAIRTKFLSTGIHAVELADDDLPVSVRRDTALVAFSSGSTGEPKAIELSHAAFANKLMAIQSVLRFASGQRALHVLQLNFTFGQWTALLTLLTGGVVELMPAFSPRRLHERLAQGDVDRVAVVPTMLRMLSRFQESDPATDPATEPTTEPASWPTGRAGVGPKLWIAGGEPLSAGLGRKVQHHYPGSLITDVYGLSETSTSDLILRPEDYQDGAGTIGTPSPGVVCRIDAPPGETGEIQISTPFLMSGYVDAAEETHRAAPDGWFRTGDIGRIRPDGRVELMGRAKTMISRGAVKVSPLEIESAYAGNMAWTDCLAVGVPDEVLGETIHLLIAQPGSALDTEELRQWGRKHLEPGKIPDAFHLVDRIPLGETGKADRRAAAAFATEAAGA